MEHGQDAEQAFCGAVTVGPSQYPHAGFAEPALAAREALPGGRPELAVEIVRALGRVMPGC